jgi:hypothetical protein
MIVCLSYVSMFVMVNLCWIWIFVMIFTKMWVSPVIWFSY